MSNDTFIPFAYAGQVLGGAIVIPVVSALIVGLRFRFRVSLKQKLGPDDWTILAAWFLVTGMCICLIYGVAKGAVGYASPPYPTKLSSPIIEELTETTRAQTIVFVVDWAIWMLMIPGNGLIKLSALFFYRRIFVVTRCGFLDTFAQLFGCGLNFEDPFGTLEQVASCNTNMRLNALMISDLITDITVWMMPLVPVWQLHMSFARKLGVTGILSLAAISLAAAIVRLIVQLEISSGGYAAHTDPNLTLTILLYWSMLESGLALIAACLLTMHLLVIRQYIGSAVYSLRNLLSTRRSGRTTNTEEMSDGPYSQISRNAAGGRLARSSQPTSRAHHEAYENSYQMGKISDEESRAELAGAPGETSGQQGSERPQFTILIK